MIFLIHQYSFIKFKFIIQVIRSVVWAWQLFQCHFPLLGILWAGLSPWRALLAQQHSARRGSLSRVIVHCSTTSKFSPLLSLCPGRVGTPPAPVVLLIEHLFEPFHSSRTVGPREARFSSHPPVSQHSVCRFQLIFPLSTDWPSCAAVPCFPL